MEADAESSSEAEDDSSYGRRRRRRRAPPRRRDRRRSQYGWSYEYDDLRNFINGQPYSQTSLSLHRDAKTEQVRDVCDRMGWERKAPGYFYQQHQNGHQICGFFTSSIRNLNLPARNPGSGHKRGYVATACLTYNEMYEPNMGGGDRTVEDNAALCQCRCKRTNGCQHFSWWQDGGCVLQGSNGRPRHSGGATSGPDGCKQPAAIPGQLDSWLKTLSVVTFSTYFGSLTYGGCPLSLVSWWRCATNCVNRKQCDHDFSKVCKPKRDHCIFMLFKSKGQDISGCQDCEGVCRNVLHKHRTR